MISAYDINLFEVCQPGASLADFVARTLVAARPQPVKVAFFDYLFKHDPAPEVWHLLCTVASDENLLKKARVITDRSWRNCVVRVTPKEISVTAGGVTTLDGVLDLDATLHYWASQAEAIFFHLDPGVPAEEAQVVPVSESRDYLLNWLFQREFGDLRKAEGESN